MLFQEEGLNAVLYSKICLCVHYSSLQISTAENQLNVVISTGLCYSIPVIWSCELYQTEVPYCQLCPMFPC